MTGPRAERGLTLIVTLVIMLLVALVALSSLRGGVRDLRVASNMQSRNEALSAAQATIERTLSSGAFIRDPAAIAAVPEPVDLDGDGRPDRVARLDPRPACLRVRPVKLAELDPEVPGDIACLGSAGGGGYGPAGGAGDSLCAETLWNVAASVSDEVTGASVRVNQGVAVRVPVSDALNGCP